MSIEHTLQVFESEHRGVPPKWALLQRLLFDHMARAGVAFVGRYTRPDGTLIWRDHWSGMDGSDDGYESFASFPLFYALGGSEQIHELARRQWDAVTRQFTQYGQVHNEFDAYYDWMHHGESSLYLYYFGLADPTLNKDRMRALRFAGMYMGEDPEADNWDSQRKLIRSPINGSRGPRFEMTAEDWVTHRPVLANYLSPYEDVPGFPQGGDPHTRLDWNNDAVFAEILKCMNQRMVPGDVPLNLTVTSLIANAYLYTGQLKYKAWVLDYLRAWERRTEDNSGIMPDNVGPEGKIGERMNGKWWGGYYGWRWPHGGRILIDSSLIAGSNALLMSGDAAHLNLARSQLDLLWGLGREQNGEFQIPNRHGAEGWFDYGSPNSDLSIHLYYLTHSAEDRARLDRCGSTDQRIVHSFGKGGQFDPEPWHAFMQGQNPEYPQHVLETTFQEVSRRMQVMENDNGDPREWDVHHWQEINPVVEMGLAQLTTGTPGVRYHGGLLHAVVRHFDPDKGRSGLPDDVAALVEHVTADSVKLQIVNTDPVNARRLVVQAGAFGEHQFAEVETLDDQAAQVKVNAKAFEILLAPAAHLRLNLHLQRYANEPSYAFPWDR